MAKLLVFGKMLLTKLKLLIGWVMVALGIPLFLLPIPLGLIIIAAGLLLVFSASPPARNYVMDRMARYPFLQRRVLPLLQRKRNGRQTAEGVRRSRSRCRL